MIRPIFIDVNPVEFNYYQFMISLHKFNGNCNAVDDLYTKMSVLSETEGIINIKVFNMITKINEAKTLVKHISCDCKCKFNSTTCNSNQKWNNKCQYECKNVAFAKNIIVVILAHVFVKIVGF